MELSEDTPWVRQYRASRRDPDFTARDEHVIAQARAVARGARSRRRCLAFAAAASFASAALVSLWPVATPTEPTNAGLLDGASQTFLMSITESGYAPGSLEGR